jgi:hypothetical protein
MRFSSFAFSFILVSLIVASPQLLVVWRRNDPPPADAVGPSGILDTRQSLLLLETAFKSIDE